jgi:hypothetical protein
MTHKTLITLALIAAAVYIVVGWKKTEEVPASGDNPTDTTSTYGEDENPYGSDPNAGA